MKNRPVLSIAPYYGGKGKMAHFIADRLNYDDSDMFVTPFGGMCRVLLNKPRHSVECYNDYSSGLTALMSILSDPNSARELIHRLCEETDHSQEVFDIQKEIFDNAQTDLEVQEKEKLRRLLIDKKIVSAISSNDLLEEMFYQSINSYTSKNSEKAKRKQFIREYEVRKRNEIIIEKSIVKLQDILKSDLKFREVFEHLLSNWIRLNKQKEEQGFIEWPADMGEYVSDMDLAIATYVTFQQSHDGMGQSWSAEKFKTNQHYKNQIVKLFDCAERLEGVQVFQIDAIEFFRRRPFVDVNTPIDTIPSKFRMLNEWINNPRVMMYCDPSYIGVESEARLLKDIDIDSTDSLSDAIKEKYADKMPKNLGKIYAKSFGYDDQEKFLRCIQNAHCRILVSNYDLVLYNKYLNESTGWRREEFETTTGVGSKSDNKRVEVIWYNY